MLHRFVLLSMLVFTVSVVAEPKQLVCISDASAEAERLANNDAKVFSSMIELCRQATFGWKHTYDFDTEGLKDSIKNNAEFSRSSCHESVSGSSGVIEVQLSATPNVITFSSAKYPTRFNIDRKTLKGGQNEERDFQCEIREIDTSDNLI